MITILFLFLFCFEKLNRLDIILFKISLKMIN